MAVRKNLNNNKTRMKSKLAIGKSRASTGDAGILVSKNKGFRVSKKAQSGESNVNGVSYGSRSRAAKEGITGKRNVNHKAAKEGITGRRNVNRKTNSKSNELGTNGNRLYETVNSDSKRKRMCADHSTDEGTVFSDNVRKLNKKFSSQMRLPKVKDELDEERRPRKGKFQSFEQSSDKISLAGGRKSKSTKVPDKRNSKANFIGKEELKNAKSKSGVGNQFEQNQTQCAADSIRKSSKKKAQSKKISADDSKIMDDRPKKKKRVIQIDPNDLSNKRLDDGILINNSVKEKKEDSKTENVELSKNAQFRAIRPSPSMLSFVEDNLLGRRREIEFRRAGYNTELSAPLDNIPFSTRTERERTEETAFRNKLSFFAAAKVSSSFPPPDLPEIAFAGRSNVGKSSLLNALTRQWGVVRTSDKPGLTQTINFFKLGSKFCLVDLPGYGFAYAKEEVKEAWEELVKEYVSTRVGLKRVCLLIDTKWGMKPRDIELIDLMERSQTKYQIVLTKTDVVFPIDVARRATQIEENLKEKKLAVQPVMMVSSKTGAGIRSLRTALSKIARFVKP